MGNKGNRRGEGYRGLVYYYEDSDGNGNGNGNCLREKGVGQEGEKGYGRMSLFYSLFSFLAEGRKIVSCCLILLLFFLSLPFNAGQLILHQVQANWWMVISCKISLPVQIWSSHFCLATWRESQLWPIAVLDIGTRQGCKLLKVVSPHLILVAQICVCIIIGIVDRVIDALKQVN